MPRPNTQFELSVDDLELIETALHDCKASLTGKLADLKKASPETREQVRDIHDLLGRLHNQKEFYRPAKGVYVGG